MTSVFVTNKSDTILADSWNGVRFVLEPNSTVEVPVEFAVHVLGAESQDKAPYLARLGWSMTANDVEEGVKKLQKFEISNEPPIVKNHSLPPVVEKVPLPTEKKAGGKLLKTA
jgi:hypothetical protein